ncbi:MAG: hypothetical protein HOQ28_11205 [Thermoleophilia bacterium]|nr:hypothetical protein [Thermoleophilia bacterium]
MKRLLLLAALLALISAATAAAANTPAKYRNTMNGICRAYTPKLKDAEDTMARATNSQRHAMFESALRRYLHLSLSQNHQLEAVRVPAKLTKQMRPVLKLLRKIDPHLYLALKLHRAGDLKSTRSQLKTINKISIPLNGRLDAAGLIDCGSNQQ